MHRNRKAKIVATLGPASESPEMIEKLFYAGADVFRLNFSHGTHEEHKARVDAIRAIEKKAGMFVGILMDIQGPKLRLGRFLEKKALLENGQEFVLDMDPALGDARRACLPHAEIFAALKPGSELMIDDGRVKLEVIDCDNSSARTKVIVGGPVSDHKGVNVPNLILPMSVITEKDREDLAHGLELGVDWVAQSFVQQPEDVRELRELVGERAKIMVKLEKPSALERLEEIVELCDGIMVARGDLGVELPPQQVPVAQKKIIRLCRDYGKPVVVATHMLDSMVSAPVPTRAEASDVATAIYDGADAVMLSAESAAGDFPEESVAMMNNIIEEVEQDPVYANIIDAQRTQPRATTADAICSALQRVTGILGTAATVTYTTSGSTTLRAARERPSAPILSLTPFETTARYLSLVWGVHAVLVNVDDAKSRLLSVIDVAKEVAVREQFVSSGEAIVIAAGIPFGVSGTTNLLHIAWID